MPARELRKYVYSESRTDNRREPRGDRASNVACVSVHISTGPGLLLPPCTLTSCLCRANATLDMHTGRSSFSSALPDPRGSLFFYDIFTFPRGCFSFAGFLSLYPPPLFARGFLFTTLVCCDFFPPLQVYYTCLAWMCWEICISRMQLRFLWMLIALFRAAISKV